MSRQQNTSRPSLTQGSIRRSLTNLLGYQRVSTVAFNTQKMQNTQRPHTMKDGIRKNIQTSLNRQGGICKQRPETCLQADKIQKTALKKNLGRVMMLAEGTRVEDDEKKITIILNLLRSLGKTNNHYEKQFSYIHSNLQQFIYANTNMLTPIIIQNSKHKSIRNFQNKSNPITLKQLCTILIQDYSFVIQQLHNSHQALDFMNRDSESEIGKLSKTIMKLKDQLEYYRKHPSENLYPYIKSLERDNEAKIIQIQAVLGTEKQLRDSFEIMEQTNIMLGDKITELKTKLYQQEMEKLSGLQQVEKNSQLKDFEDNVEVFKEMLDKSIIKMYGMKAQFDKLKSYNDDLINERSSLAKRAAVGFGELTPRPNYKAIFSELQMDYSNIISDKKKVSTENIFKTVLGKFKSYYEKKRELSPRMNVVNYHKNQGENCISEEVIQHIHHAKSQIRYTHDSAERVKKIYSKEKIKKEQIQSNK